MIAAARKVSAICSNFVIKIPCTEAGVAAARRLEKEGIRTNVTLVFSPAQAIWPAKNGSLFVSPFLGWKEANGEDCKQYIKDIVDIYKNYGFYGKTQISAPPSAHPSRSWTALCRCRHRHHRTGSLSGRDQARLHPSALRPSSMRGTTP